MNAWIYVGIAAGAILVVAFFGFPLIYYCCCRSSRGKKQPKINMDSPAIEIVEQNVTLRGGPSKPKSAVNRQSAASDTSSAAPGGVLAEVYEVDEYSGGIPLNEHQRPVMNSNQVSPRVNAAAMVPPPSSASHHQHPFYDGSFRPPSALPPSTYSAHHQYRPSFSAVSPYSPSMQIQQQSPLNQYRPSFSSVTPPYGPQQQPSVNQYRSSFSGPSPPGQSSPYQYHPDVFVSKPPVLFPYHEQVSMGIHSYAASAYPNHGAPQRPNNFIVHPVNHNMQIQQQQQKQQQSTSSDNLNRTNIPAPHVASNSNNGGTANNPKTSVVTTIPNQPPRSSSVNQSNKLTNPPKNNIVTRERGSSDASTELSGEDGRPPIPPKD